MGNSIGRARKKAKVMKITGETFKLRTPVQARDAMAGYPGHVLLNSDMVQQFGIRARPLDPEQPLEPNKLYFLVQLPADAISSYSSAPRRVRSGIHMSAKDRLEYLMLSRRSVSELPIARSAAASSSEAPQSAGSGLQVRMRLSKAQMAELVDESRDEREIAERVLRLYMTREREGKCGDGDEIDGGRDLPQHHRADQLKAADLGVHSEKRVTFNPMERGEILEL
ncbi:uncharacterized protein At1g66480-like [Punica granatum]|uniref:Uncharacterized protein At1g66480-like n=1 Tax=Punica granatum TaxID=22663 RepID=A0A6P8D8Y8_PUNGR|nr:uncharacterized protein At1g66480-like [Punica granatum]